jgi:hypothetical protein
MANIKNFLKVLGLSTVIMWGFNSFAMQPKWTTPQDEINILDLISSDVKTNDIANLFDLEQVYGDLIKRLIKSSYMTDIGMAETKGQRSYATDLETRVGKYDDAKNATKKIQEEQKTKLLNFIALLKGKLEKAKNPQNRGTKLNIEKMAKELAQKREAIQKQKAAAKPAQPAPQPRVVVRQPTAPTRPGQPVAKPAQPAPAQPQPKPVEMPVQVAKPAEVKIEVEAEKMPPLEATSQAMEKLAAYFTKKSEEKNINNTQEWWDENFRNVEKEVWDEIGDFIKFLDIQNVKDYYSDVHKEIYQSNRNSLVQNLNHFQHKPNIWWNPNVRHNTWVTREFLYKAASTLAKNVAEVLKSKEVGATKPETPTPTFAQLEPIPAERPGHRRTLSETSEEESLFGAELPRAQAPQATQPEKKATKESEQVKELRSLEKHYREKYKEKKPESAFMIESTLDWELEQPGVLELYDAWNTTLIPWNLVPGDKEKFRTYYDAAKESFQKYKYGPGKGSILNLDLSTAWVKSRLAYEAAADAAKRAADMLEIGGIYRR